MQMTRFICLALNEGTGASYKFVEKAKREIMLYTATLSQEMGNTSMYENVESAETYG